MAQETTTNTRRTDTVTGTSTPPSVEQTLSVRDGAPVATAATAATAGTAGTAGTDQGDIRIADTVVSKIAGLAAREVSGVHSLGGGAARAFGAIRERIPGASSNVSQGVTVEVGQRQTAVDLDIVVEYGVAIAELARAIRRNVITALERMTGLEVVEVNVSVNDVHIPSPDDAEEPAAPARVA